MRIPQRWPGRAAAVALALAMLTLTAPASAAATPPFDLLAQGPAPTTVPYAIGTKIFYQGQAFVVPPAGQSTGLVRVQPYHGNVLTSIFAGAVDFQGPV